MAALIYTTITSLDGFVEDASGEFSFLAPKEDVFAFVNDLERPIGTCLYGRRMYEVMQVWETMGTEPDASPAEREFGQLWRAQEKVVYSRTMAAASTERTRIERTFDAETVGRLKADASTDVGLGGATLAGEAIRLGLVDEIQLLVMPVAVGSGKRALPEARTDLSLLDTHRFASGTVYLRYAVVSPTD